MCAIAGMGPQSSIAPAGEAQSGWGRESTEFASFPESIRGNGGKVAGELRPHRQTAGWVSVKKSQIRELDDG
jgi:hypothetical protein